MAASWWPGSFSEPKAVVVLPVTLPEQPSSLALSRFAGFASYQSLFCCTPIKKKVQRLFFYGVNPIHQTMNHLYKMHMTHTHLSGGGIGPSKALQGTDETFPGSQQDERVVTAAPGNIPPPTYRHHLLSLLKTQTSQPNLHFHSWE